VSSHKLRASAFASLGSKEDLNTAHDGALPPQTSATTKSIYKLASEVSGYWVPLVPVKTTTGLRLQRGKVLKLDGKQEFMEVQGRILNAAGRTRRA